MCVYVCTNSITRGGEATQSTHKKYTNTVSHAIIIEESEMVNVICEGMEKGWRERSEEWLAPL